LVETHGRRFVDLDSVASGFPSFAVVQFLRTFEPMSVEQIAAAVTALPEESIALRFHSQLRLCRVFAIPNVWLLLRTFSIPSLIKDPLRY
jgi:hypothetical protein